MWLMEATARMTHWDKPGKKRTVPRHAGVEKARLEEGRETERIGCILQPSVGTGHRWFKLDGERWRNRPQYAHF
jgi:hypothetical protein